MIIPQNSLPKFSNKLTYYHEWQIIEFDIFFVVSNYSFKLLLKGR